LTNPQSDAQSNYILPTSGPATDGPPTDGPPTSDSANPINKHYNGTLYINKFMILKQTR